MSKDTNAPQAFPYCGAGDELNYSKGMTLRDYFAAKAMQAAATYAVTANGFTFFERADWAYQQADAMIAARNKK